MENNQNAQLTSAKICAIPKENSWAQAYSAGGLFAVLSLTKQSENEGIISHLGKQLLDALEKEFFTLEEKNLTSIKDALEKTSRIIPSSFDYSLIVSFIHSAQNILYVFIANKGNVLLKREDKLGLILSGNSNNDGKILSASGFLQKNDLIILETEGFSNIVSDEKLFSLCDNSSPSEIAENLTPLVHEKEEGEASAIFVKYLIKTLEEKDQENIEIINKEKVNFSFPIKIPQFKFLKEKLTHSKKMFLTIAFVLFTIFIVSIFFAIKKQESDRQGLLFQKSYVLAQQKYDEGQSLLSLNKNSAIDDFKKAQKILSEAKPKFKIGSKEYVQIENLLKKINEVIAAASGINFITASLVDKTSSPLLKYALENPNFLLSQDNNYIYALNEKEIDSINKGSQKSTPIQSGSWSSVIGFSNYYGNLYLLDKKNNQVLKLVKGESEYGKSNYFSNPPSLANATSMAVDGSVWILFKDGTIQKFTKGSQESFKNPTLDEPLKNPQKIFTDINTDNLYILEPTQERIVVIGKDGSLHAQYKSKILKRAKDFEVIEKEKTIYFLADGKIYKIELK